MFPALDLGSWSSWPREIRDRFVEDDDFLFGMSVLSRSVFKCDWQSIGKVLACCTSASGRVYFTSQNSHQRASVLNSFRSDYMY